MITNISKAENEAFLSIYNYVIRSCKLKLHTINDSVQASEMIFLFKIRKINYYCYIYQTDKPMH